MLYDLSNDLLFIYLFMTFLTGVVILKYSSVENYFWRKTQLKFGKHASLATHTYSKTIRMQAIFFYQSFCLPPYKDLTLVFLSIYNIDAVYSKC